MTKQLASKAPEIKPEAKTAGSALSAPAKQAVAASHQKISEALEKKDRQEITDLSKQEEALKFFTLSPEEITELSKTSSMPKPASAQSYTFPQLSPILAPPKPLVRDDIVGAAPHRNRCQSQRYLFPTRRSLRLSKKRIQAAG